ncbi:MAG: LysE family transporter [Prochlorothrix sp.]|nr:LysE family transporter [Prochlorothrix sp.]
MEWRVFGEILVRGWVLGLAIAAPVGPIGVLCIRQTLAQGWRVGLATGLGAATADGLYGCVAALGVSAVSAVLLQYQQVLQGVGGLFLGYLGVVTFCRSPAQDTAVTGELQLWQAYSTTLGLTLMNPATILAFTAIFAGLGLGTTTGNPGDAIALVLGIGLGSASWWLLLSGITARLRHRLTGDRLLWINRLSGGVITAFGAIALGQAWAAL